VRKMLIPIRCFTCGNLIAHKWEDYANKVKKGEAPEKVLSELGFEKYCCRRMFLGHKNVFDDVKMYGSKGP